jgi:hypothetical protein
MQSAARMHLAKKKLLRHVASRTVANAWRCRVARDEAYIRRDCLLRALGCCLPEDFLVVTFRRNN